MDVKDIIGKQSIKKVVIFGAGKIGGKICSKLKEWGITVLEIWDNGNLHEVNGVSVRNPHSYEELAEKPDKVIISMDLFYKKECLTQCLEMGVPLEKIESTVAIRMWPLDKWGKVE